MIEDNGQDSDGSQTFDVRAKGPEFALPPWHCGQEPLRCRVSSRHDDPDGEARFGFEQ